MGEHLGVVLGAPERSDPFPCQTVFLRALGAGNLSVGDVAHQNVEERVLRLLRYRRPAHLLHEVLAFERVKMPLGRTAIHVSKPGDGTKPEHLADYRRVLEQALLLTRERVETRGDNP